MNESFKPKNENRNLVAVIKDLWQKERREGDPKINFHFVFGSHLNQSDLVPIEKEFSGSDIYIMEGVGWNDSAVAALSELSGGIATPKELENERLKIDPNFKKNPFYSFIKAQMNMIHRSGKIIALVDIPRNHPWIAEKNKLEIEKGEIRNMKNLDEKVRKLKSTMARDEDLNTYRENYMLQGMPRIIREVLDERRPGLKNKQEVKVLVSLGARHTPVFMLAKETMGSAVERTFESLPFIFGFQEEIQRRISFGQKIESIPEELFIKAIFEYEFYYYFEKSLARMTNISGRDLSKKLRKLVDTFSVEEIREVYDIVNQGRKFRDIVLEICKRKGVETKGL